MKSAVFGALLIFVGFAPAAHAISFAAFREALSVDPNLMVRNYLLPDSEACGDPLIQTVSLKKGESCESPDDKGDIQALLDSGDQKHPLAGISTNDARLKKNKTSLDIISDGTGDLRGIYLRTEHHGDAQDGETTDQNFDVNDMEHRPVIVQCDHNAIKLQILSMSPNKRVVDIRVFYLASVFSGYASCDATIVRRGDRWEIFNRDGQAVSDIFVDRGTFGIALTNLCPNNG